MKCHHVRAAIPKLIDGVLDFDTDFAVRQHLRLCRDCQSVFHIYQRDERALAQHIRRAPYAPVARDVLARVEHDRGSWWGAFLSGGNRLASVAGLLLVVLIVGAGALALRDVATNGTTDDGQDQEIISMSSPDEETSWTDSDLIGADDVGYIIEKLEDNDLVVDLDIRNETQDYLIEYNRIAFDRHLTLVEYRAEAFHDDSPAVHVDVRSEPEERAAQPIPFVDGKAEGWLALSGVYPGATHVYLDEFIDGRQDSHLSHEIEVDLSPMPYYDEGITHYDVATTSNGVEICCLTIERGVAVSTITWDASVVDPDALVSLDSDMEAVSSTVQQVSPELTVDGEPVRLLDTGDYPPLMLDSSGVVVYRLPAEGNLTLQFDQLDLPVMETGDALSMVHGEWTLDVPLDVLEPAPEPTPESTVPPQLAQEPVPTPEPEIEATPAPTEDEESVEHLRVLVYMVRGDEIGVSAREIPYTQQVATASIEALLMGPNYTDQDAGLHSEIPAGTQLRNITLTGGILTVDLSAEFLYGADSDSMLMRLAQIVHTGTQFDSVEAVEVLAEGEPIETGDGLTVHMPFDRNDFEQQAPMILIEQPGPGEQVMDPVRISGTANTFEATLQIEIIGPNGEMLYSGHDMASSGTGTRGTFDLSIPIELDTEGWGTIRMFEYSARDGSRINVVEVPVQFVLES